MHNTVGSSRSLRSHCTTTEAIKRFASATQRAIARCHKTNAPIPSDRWRNKCYVLGLCTLQTSACGSKWNIGIRCNSRCRWTWIKPALHMPSFITVGRVSNKWRSYSLSFSLLVCDLASRIDYSYLGPRMLTLNLIHFILQLKLACWIWGRWKYWSWIFYIEFCICILHI